MPEPRSRHLSRGCPRPGSVEQAIRRDRSGQAKVEDVVSGGTQRLGLARQSRTVEDRLLGPSAGWAVKAGRRDQTARFDVMKYPSGGESLMASDRLRASRW